MYLIIIVLCVEMYIICHHDIKIMYRYPGWYGCITEYQMFIKIRSSKELSYSIRWYNSLDQSEWITHFKKKFSNVSVLQKMISIQFELLICILSLHLSMVGYSDVISLLELDIIINSHSNSRSFLKLILSTISINTGPNDPYICGCHPK